MDRLTRKLTFNEIDEVARLELSIVEASGDLNQEELKEFEIIIRAEMLYWTYIDYFNYMSSIRRETN